MSGLKDAETGQRGYLLTRNPEFLEPYIGSYLRVFQSYNDVKRLTIDNPGQQNRLDTLRILINDRFNQISTTIELEKRGQSDSAQNIVKQGHGKKIMDTIRTLVNKMVQDEIVLRRERNEAVRATSFLMPIFILIFSAVALLIAIIFYVLINRDNLKRMDAERRLKATKDELEQSYEELTVREEQLRALNMELEDRVKERTHEVLHSVQKLRESEMRYRLLIEGVADYAIFMLDPRGIIISWNYGAERLKGYKEKEIIGKHFSIFYPKEMLDINFPEQELRIAREKGKYAEEGWRVRKDGTVFWASVLINAVYDEQDQLIGFSKITRDLTERKKAEDNLRKEITT